MATAQRIGPPPNGSLASTQLSSVARDYFASEVSTSAFLPSTLLPILVRAAQAPLVPEVYVFPATPAMVLEMERAGVSKAVWLNAAAEAVFGPPPPREADDIMYLEVGINGLAGLNEGLREVGIKEGLVDGTLFIALHPRHLQPNSRQASGLVYEQWALYVLSPSGRLMPGHAIVRRESASGRLAPGVSTARRAGASETTPQVAKVPKEKGWYIQLYRAPDGLRVFRPLFKVE